MGQELRVFMICLAGILLISTGINAAGPVSDGIVTTGDPWNSLEIAKLLVSLLVPLLLLILGYLFNQRLKEIELQNQRQRDEIERRYKPHIGFTIACNFFGPHHGWYIAEFVISVKNTSLIQQKFKEIFLRVRGIRRDETPELWEGHGDRLKFSHPLIKADLIPQDWNYIFVEPGVTQQISFISRVPEDIHYIVALAEFSYDEYTPHSIERMFEVRDTTAHPRFLNTAA